MQLANQAQLARLLANGSATAEAIARDGDTPDHVPVIKLFTPEYAPKTPGPPE